MPIKYNLTKYDILANKIHKISIHYNNSKEKGKGNSNPINSEDYDIKIMAIIIASFTSSHSWETHKSIENKIYDFNSEKVRQEYLEALNERWKHINTYDIQEFASLNLSDSIFYRWLFFNINKKEQDLYKSAWKKLKEEMDKPNLSSIKNS